MRSKLITVVTVVASVVLVAQVAAADQVQEQLRLMEQRMAEMEDRLQATSDELRTAKATVSEQQELLQDSGLIEGEDAGIRSGVGGFLDMVDISGVVAASYNHRLINSSVPGNGNEGLFKTPNANTFQVDQVWVTLDKTPTDESRGGFHTEFFTGQSAESQNGNGERRWWRSTAPTRAISPRSATVSRSTPVAWARRSAPKSSRPTATTSSPRDRSSVSSR